jgi:endonuclease/exonuclease/phosphatase (EEP) superfamily protein YafD
MIDALALTLLIAISGQPATPPAPAAPSFRAMTFNVLYESAAADVDKTLAAIRREAPDIVCMQEVTSSFAKRARTELGYAHSVAEPRSGTWGVAIFSKHPIKKHAVFAQSPHKMPAIEATVRMPAGELTVACVHLFPPGAKRFASDDLATTMQKNATLRAEQARALVKRYAKVDRALMLGDFNEGRDDAALRVLRDAGWSHACEGEGARCGGTWPGSTSAMPALFEIDHVLGRGVVLRDAHVVKDGGSDHFAVVISFSLQ